MIALLPAGTETTASSRLRVYTFARELSRRGIEHEIGVVHRAAILVVQKKLTLEVIKLAQEAKRSGATVVYDVDDLGAALWWWAPEALFMQMIDLANGVIVATDQQARVLHDQYGAQCVHVIPNCIDYYLGGCLPHPATSSSPLRLLWFGDGSNLDLVKKYLPTLLSLDDAQVVVCSDVNARDDFRHRWPAAIFIPWTLAGFTETLRSCHVTCLMHDGDEDDRSKANNRMVTSIAWGVPACVSRTPAYVRTAQEGKVDRFVFGNPEELAMAVNALRHREQRVEYLARAQDPLWSLYSPAAIATRYLSALQSIAATGTA